MLVFISGDAIELKKKLKSKFKTNLVNFNKRKVFLLTELY